MSTDSMTYTIVVDRLACGCSAETGNHIEGCILGQAETIAGEALATAAPDTHPLTAALIALTEAGMLATAVVNEEQLHDILMGLLDDLYEADLLAGLPPRAEPS